MRVLLLCPPPSLDPPLARPRRAPHFTAILAAALRDRGHDVVVQDAALVTCDLLRIAADARRAGPERVLLCHSDYNRRTEAAALERIAAALIDALPGVPLVLYGRLDARHAEQALAQTPSVDLCLFGEPDRTVPDWLDGASAGTVERREGAFLITPAAVGIPDDSPVPAWDLLPPEHYGFAPHQQGADVVFPVLASRGCPFPCFYCEVRARPAWAPRPVEAVLAELDVLRTRYGARSVFLADPTFGVDRAWALRFCAVLQATGWDLRWSCMCRTDRVDAALLQAMADAGCWNVLFGIESLQQPALDGARKNLDAATVAPAIAAAKAAGIETIASIMIGLPGDTPAGVERTVDRIIELDPDFAQFFVLQLDGDDAPDGGRFLGEWTGAKHDFWGRACAPEAFESLAELERLRRRAFRRFYLRPRYVAGRLRALARSGEARAQLGRAARGGLLALRMATGRHVA